MGTSVKADQLPQLIDVLGSGMQSLPPMLAHRLAEANDPNLQRQRAAESGPPDGGAPLTDSLLERIIAERGLPDAASVKTGLPR